MEQHPIPQDVTGFQFKLIGSMTVKQFGFVAAGIILAVILFYLPIQGLLAIPIKLILIPLFGISGIIIAFIPIEGRPADVMASNFIKALFAPNQYVYKRQGKQFSFSKIATVSPALAQQQAAAAQAAAAAARQKTQDSRGARLEAFLLESTQSQVRNKLDEKELAFFKNISAIAGPAGTAQPSTQAAMPPATSAAVPAPAVQPAMTTMQTPAAFTPSPTQSTTATPIPPIQADKPAAPEETETKAEELDKEEAALEKQLAVAKEEETKASPTDTSAAHQKMLELEKKIQEIHQQKLQAEKDLQEAQKQLEQAKQEPIGSPALATPSTDGTAVTAPQPAEAAPASNMPHVRVVPQGTEQTLGLPHTPDTPNVVVGIVKDPRGNALSNILVEIKDKDNNPVRAFKTNALGHFASATPLATGTYTIELEDPKKQNRFDVIQLVANNQILLPLEIISHDAREELRKQLFN